MSKQAFAGLAFAGLLLAGCSKQGTIQSVAAQSPSPEPVDRSATVQPASAPPQPVAPQPAESPYNPQPVETASQPTYDGPTIPAGTPLRVRLDESLGTKRDRTGERFYASLAEPIVMDGHTVLPAGSRFVGHLTESKPSGRLKGRAVLAVRLDAVDWHGREYAINTSAIARVSHGRKGHDFRWIAGGGGFGALIGGIAGGGGGALIGAGVGAGAGTAGALVSGKKQLHLSAETPLTFTLRRPVQL